ncbi:DUF3918 family protein [Microbacteriaceae bacterium 4G12]
MKLRSSLIAIGLGAAAYRYARKGNMLSARNVKRARRMLRSYL